MPTITVDRQFNMDTYEVFVGDILFPRENRVRFQDGSQVIRFDSDSDDLTYDGSDNITGGTVDEVRIQLGVSDTIVFEALGGLDALTLFGFLQAGDSDGFFAALTAGNDTITATQDLEVDGSTTNIDVLDGGDGDDTMFGGAGEDILRGGDDNDILNGEGDADELFGQGGDDTLNGDGGADVLYGGGGTDTFDGGAGNDTVDYSSLAAVTADLSDNNNNAGSALGETYTDVENLTGSAFADSLTGDSGDNILMGLDGDDTLVGGTGSDTLIGGAGADILDGSVDGADDVASYETAEEGVLVDLTDLDGSENTGDAAGDQITFIQDLLGSDFNDELIGNSEDNILYGADGDDTLRGGTGADILNGGDGDDVLEGGDDADELNGGDGTDEADYSNASSGVTLSLETGGTVGDADGDTYDSVENVTGTSDDDVITGDDEDNEISGGSGADVLTGGDGDDTLRGGGGTDQLLGGNNDDTLLGGGGADVLNGGSGSDTADYSTDNDGIEVYLDAADGTNTDDAAGDTYVSVENVTTGDGDDIIVGDSGDNILSGGIGEDDITGGQGADTLFGGNGDDTLTGGGADDILVGGGGEDTMVGGSGTDTASYEDTSRKVKVSLDGSITATNDAVGDTFDGIENLTGGSKNDTLVGDSDANVLDGGAGGKDRLEGLGGADTLLGNGGRDKMFGGNGDDTLWGGNGNDRYNGGNGSDTFIFDSEQSGFEIIVGFDEAEDTIAIAGISGPSDITLSHSNNRTFLEFGDTEIQIRGAGTLELNEINFDFGSDVSEFL